MHDNTGTCETNSFYKLDIRLEILFSNKILKEIQFETGNDLKRKFNSKQNNVIKTFL